MLNVAQDPNAGLLLYPYEEVDHPGYPRLDVFIPTTPTYPHFEARRAKLKTITHTGDVERVSISHPWASKDKYRVSPGHLYLIDRENEQLEFFMFGGDVQIATDDEQTTCSFTSPSPILPMHTIHDLAMWLVVEIEVLLARQEARWNPPNFREFDVQLATIEPSLLYASCLQALHEKSLEEQAAHVRGSDKKLERQGQRFVQKEIERLKASGAWPVREPVLADLF